MTTDHTQRFSSRVEDYARWRPGYPDGVLRILEDETGLDRTSVIADVGSGTGLSSELFLRHGCTVHSVEPSDEMRRAAETFLTHYPNFHSIRGTAEATTLPDRSVDYVVAAQAFHWFDPSRTRREWVRILKTQGWVALLWNSRRTDGTPFLRSYEALLKNFGTDYEKVRHENIPADVFMAFFAQGAYQRHVLYNEQRLDFEGLKGRLLSSSYVPSPGHPSHLPMLEELRRIFKAHQEQGRICFEYDTELYFGHLAEERVRVIG
jgi:SAM-dependent methyltransferase